MVTIFFFFFWGGGLIFYLVNGFSIANLPPAPTRYTFQILLERVILLHHILLRAINMA